VVVIPVMIILNVVMAVVIVVAVALISGPSYYDDNGFRVRGDQSEQP